MKIAVTYDNGNIFQHFGRTENFKVYDVEDGKVVSSQIIGSNGIGHGALAGLLAEGGVQVLICGGLGGGALNALESAGIEVCAGASGSCDEAVEAYLKGELVDTGANCDHHDEEGGCCGHGEEEGGCCGGGEEECGGCEEAQGGCGGCCGGAPAYTMEGKNVGKSVKVHYRGTLNDGTQFDSSYDRGETLDFVCGVGMMIPGFDAAVADMEPGEHRDVHLTPEEAYGPADPEAVITLEIASLPGAEAVSVGERVYLQDPYGQPIPVRITAKDEKTVTFDANHEMAGKELNFHIELVEAN